MTGTTIHIPTLTTERLNLRAPKMSDFDTYAAFRESDRALGLGGPYTRTQSFDQLCEVLGHWALRGFGRWMVADKKTDQPLGVVGVFHPEDWPEPEIAWTVFAQAEGRGIAAEAAIAARAYAYGTLGWTTVMSLITPDNARSIKLAERIGAKFESIYAHPTIGDMHLYRHPAPGELA